jgi:hypothetical protein
VGRHAVCQRGAPLLGGPAGLERQRRPHAGRWRRPRRNCHQRRRKHHRRGRGVLPAQDCVRGLLPSRQVPRHPHPQRGAHQLPDCVCVCICLLPEALLHCTVLRPSPPQVDRRPPRPGRKSHVCIFRAPRFEAYATGFPGFPSPPRHAPGRGRHTGVLCAACLCS